MTAHRQHRAGTQSARVLETLAAGPASLVVRRRPSRGEIDAAFEFYREMRFAEPDAPEPQAPPSGTGTEKYRHECEVLHVKRLDAEARERHLEGVARRRGEKAAARLRNDAAKENI